MDGDIHVASCQLLDSFQDVAVKAGSHQDSCIARSDGGVGQHVHRVRCQQRDDPLWETGKTHEWYHYMTFISSQLVE